MIPGNLRVNPLSYGQSDSPLLERKLDLQVDPAVRR